MLHISFFFYSFHLIIECDIHIPSNQNTGKIIFDIYLEFLVVFFLSAYLEESISIPITSLSSTYVPTTSPNFPRLTPYTTLRRSSSRTNV